MIMININKIKVAIVIDNPDRDLLALRDVAVNLVSMQVTVDLVPMYFIKPYMLGELPNIIIFNYARINNSHLIKMANNLNIKTAVLDTEGGVWVDLNIFVNIVKSSRAPCLDLYMTWGESQKIALAEVHPKIAENFYITGHPRFDRNINMVINRTDDSYVLINTNFPSVFPKYESFESEFNISQNSGALSIEAASEFFRNATVTYGKFLEFISNLIGVMPETKFLIRTHPFENESRYRVIFINSKNVTVSSSGDVYHAFKNAFCLIHFDCTTAIEAHLAGLPVGSIETCYFGQKRQLLPKSLSKELFTINEAIEFINKSKSEIHLESKKRSFDDLLINFFGPLDGLAAKRIAEAVLLIVNKFDNKPNRKVATIMEYISIFCYKFFKFLPFYFFILLKGSSKKRIDEKSFNLNDLLLENNNEFKIKKISNKLDIFFNVPTSIRLKKNEAK
jgi:surface carbohydrate biosynthesis protein